MFGVLGVERERERILSSLDLSPTIHVKFADPDSG
jgi:hypothetical protein